MKKYIKGINAETKEVLGISDIFFEGFLEEPQEVEISDKDFKCYLKGYAPMKSDEDKARETDEQRISDIDQELLTLDTKSTRDSRCGLINVVDALEKILTNLTDVKGNVARIKDVKAKINFLRAYENDAIALREERLQLWEKWHKVEAKPEEKPVDAKPVDNIK